LLENGKTIKQATSENSKFGSCGSVDNCGSSAGKYLGPASCGVPNQSIIVSAPLAISAPASNLALAALLSNLAPAARSANSAASIPLAPAARSANSATSAKSAPSANSAHAARLDRQIWHLRLIGRKIRLGRQIRIRRQFIGSSAPSAAPSANSAPSAIRLHRQFFSIGNSAPLAALSENLDPLANLAPSALHRQFSSVGGSVCKFKSVSVGNSAASAIRLHRRLHSWQIKSCFLAAQSAKFGYLAPSAAPSANSWFHWQIGLLRQLRWQMVDARTNKNNKQQQTGRRWAKD
jgi:hypothetical protein